MLAAERAVDIVAVVAVDEKRPREGQEPVAVLAAEADCHIQTVPVPCECGSQNFSEMRLPRRRLRRDA